MNPSDVLIAIPVKPFGVAKRRLDPLLDAHQRSRIGKAVAAHVISQSREAGCPVAVVTGDGGVSAWAHEQGAEVIREPASDGLDGAATAAVTEARRRRKSWMVVHADLPSVAAADLVTAATAIPRDGLLLAPSHDGGTNLLAGDRDSFPFSYGRNSFRRHLRSAAHLPHRLLVRPGLALDLDGPDDLRVLVNAPAGRWLSTLLPGPGGPPKDEDLKPETPLA